MNSTYTFSQALFPHPQRPVATPLDLHASATLDTDSLLLCYRLTGDLSALIIPELQQPEAVDGLWQHTCFELFITGADEMAYREFNFSPSRQWAAYAFSDYRQRCPHGNPLDQAPLIVTKSRCGGDVHCLQLEARLARSCLPPKAAGQPWQLGLTAVLEMRMSDHDRPTLSYWALAHPSAQPDFHHRAGWVGWADWPGD